MSKRSIKFDIMIPPVTKKNHQRIVMNRNTGKPMVIPSKPYETYEKNAGWFIRGDLRKLKIDKPVNVKCVYFMPNKRRVDLTNLLEATDDILVKYGVLEDDNSRIIVSHDGSRVYVDEKHPRTEITISFYE